MYQQRIRMLEESFRLLEQKILNQDGDLNSLYEQKTKIHRELSELRRKQYEEQDTHEYDDDR